MSVQLQDRYPDPMMSPAFTAFGDGQIQPGFSPYAQPGLDGVSRLLDPNADQYGAGYSTSASGGISSIIGQLVAIISQLLSSAGNTLGNWSNGSGGGSEQYFSSASGGSNGDPHLSFNGSTWNDMQSENDLLDSDSIPGGYRLSTQTTAPNTTGVTYNQQATVTTDRGNTSVTLDKNGNATYTQNGITNTIANGQTINLRNGETVTRNQNGALTITNTSPSGGQITTTMSQNGHGVDVNVTAQNINLGGTLVNTNPSTPAPTPPPLTPLPPYIHPTPIRYDAGGW